MNRKIIETIPIVRCEIHRFEDQDEYGKVNSGAELVCFTETGDEIREVFEVYTEGEYRKVTQNFICTGQAAYSPRKSDCKGVHCKCMNLDKKCSGAHFGDHPCSYHSKCKAGAKTKTALDEFKAAITARRLQGHEPWAVIMSPQKQRELINNWLELHPEDKLCAGNVVAGMKLFTPEEVIDMQS
jgi:hypothetical protein